MVLRWWGRIIIRPSSSSTHPCRAPHRRDALPSANGAPDTSLGHHPRLDIPGGRGSVVHMQQLSPEVLARLSPSDRLRLIEQLWDSLDRSEIPVTPAQQLELERRLATFEQDRQDAVTWNELEAELTQRCP